MSSSNVTWHLPAVQREQRQHQNGHRSAVLWFTGLSSSGKSTLAHAVDAQLHDLACRSYVLDGDNVRHGLCGDLGFSSADRTENIRRVGEVCKLFVDAGLIVSAAFISPFRADRASVRNLFVPGDFIEIYCRCDIGICEQRDVKGLYQRARAGKVQSFTGISSPYEEPGSPELIIDTAITPLNQCVSEVMAYLRKHDLLPRECEPGAGAGGGQALR